MLCGFGHVARPAEGVDGALRLKVDLAVGAKLNWDWIHPWIGLDWIGSGGNRMPVTPYMISNHCSTVDDVSVKL